MNMPQVIGASDDGKEYDEADAQLQLANGTPRSALAPISGAFISCSPERKYAPLAFMMLVGTPSACLLWSSFTECEARTMPVTTWRCAGSTSCVSSGEGCNSTASRTTPA